MLLAWGAFALLACGDTSQDNDGGGDFLWTPTCPRGVDKSVDIGTAVKLDAGKSTEGYICPRNDKDYYKITVPAGKKLVRVNLMHKVANTPVDLSYRILDSKDQLIGKAPAWTGSGLRRFDEYHCVNPGTYFIMVYDEGNDEKDGNNAYKLSYQTVVDPDANEPNNSQGAAKAVGGKGGYISCSGDVDYYKISVPSAGKLLDVKLSNTGITEVDLKYSIYDSSQKKIGEAANPDGTKGSTNLKTIHAVPAPGTYYITVEDDKGDDSDPQKIYNLAVKVINEPDPKDQKIRNDTPQNATVLGSLTCGGTKTWTVSGAQIASKSDVDYYKVIIPKCSSLVVMEVGVDFKGSSKVDPQISYIYPHQGTACTTDACCRVINKDCAKNDILDCLRLTYSCITKGDAYCNNSK